jgi:hypothetical protein
MFRQDGSCPALLKDLHPGFPYGAVTRSGPPFQTVQVPKIEATGLVRFRSPLLTESRLMSFPPATEMFQFAGFASHAYGFSMGYPYGWVAPFGDPGINDRSHLPRAFRSVPRPSSPLSAKASTRCPYFALERHTQRQRPFQITGISDRGSEPIGATKLSLSEDTDGTHQPQSTAPWAIPLGRRFRLGHTTRFFTMFDQQPTPASQHRSLGANSVPLPRSNPCFRLSGFALANPCRRDRPSRLAMKAALSSVVEVNGLEPSTSCLQSRRSPS